MEMAGAFWRWSDSSGGCAGQADPESLAEPSESAAGNRRRLCGKETASLEDFHLRDKAAVYEDDDEDSLVTMYLTVREGNSAENTDHTWTEINTTPSTGTRTIIFLSI